MPNRVRLRDRAASSCDRGWPPRYPRWAAMLLSVCWSGEYRRARFFDKFPLSGKLALISYSFWRSLEFTLSKKSFCASVVLPFRCRIVIAPVSGFTPAIATLSPKYSASSANFHLHPLKLSVDSTKFSMVGALSDRFGS